VSGRLDRVAIATSRDVIELSWASRDRLLHEIRNLGEHAKPIRTAVGAVGASRPVELSRADQTTLFSAIQLWADSVTVEALPPGIWQLRCALADQLDEPITDRNRSHPTGALAPAGQIDRDRPNTSSTGSGVMSKPGCALEHRPRLRNSAPWVRSTQAARAKAASIRSSIRRSQRGI
jgi:hypothetical protein